MNFSDAGYVAKLIGGIAGKKEGIGSHVLQQILAAQNSAVTQSASTEKAVNTLSDEVKSPILMRLKF